MNKMLLLAVFHLLLTQKVIAACPGYKMGAASSIALPASINIPRSAKVGDVIFTATSPPPTNPLANCNQNLYSVARSNRAYTKSSLSGVYETGVPGIGFTIVRPQHDNATMILDGSVQDQIKGRISYGGQWINWGFKLVVTGSVSSGTINAFQNPVVTSYMSSSLTGISDWGNQMNTFYINGTTKIITEKGCTLTTFDKTVLLPEVNKNELKATPGISNKYKDFAINLSCTPDTKLSVKFEGSVMSGKNDVLANLSTGTTSAQSSVGIQILFKKNPVVLQQQLLLVNSAISSQTLPFTAHYYYNGGADLQAGEVTSTSTFTLNYQ